MYRIIPIVLACVMPLAACAGTRGAAEPVAAADTAAPASSFSEARGATAIILVKFKTPKGKEGMLVLGGVAVGPQAVLTSAIPYRQAKGTGHTFTVMMFGADRDPLGPFTTGSPRVHDRTGLMLLMTKEALPTHAMLAPDAPSERQTVHSFGFLTFKQLLPVTAHRGMISMVYDQGAGPDFILVEMPVDRGRIGCGVFDDAGRLAGIIISLVGHQESKGEYDPYRAAVIGVDAFKPFLKANSVGETASAQ